MDDMIRLFEAKEAARQCYEMYATANTIGKTAEERVALDVAYGASKRQWMKAEHAYRLAVERQL